MPRVKLPQIVKYVASGIIITWCLSANLFGQSPETKNILAPGTKPTVFLQEGVTVPNDESAPSFTPDGNGVYLTDHNAICFSKKINGKWIKPVIIAISGKWKDWDATLSPDGKRMIFVSNRPLEDMPQDRPQPKAHLWYADALPDNGWTQPRHIDAPVNLQDFNDFAPSISKKGSLCFCSRGRDGNKGMCAYYAKWMGDHFDKPIRLVLNGNNDTFDPYISPDESYIIFASERALFISYRMGNDWSPGEKLSEQVNIPDSQNGGPYVSPDGKTLYYSSSLTDAIMMIPINIPNTH
ncbi:hypothetical protein [Mucilaginibacter sp. L3T2-6]|uniref:hypothetical protein n=1 Tax=Mucilaginibacter sp. L3T2-6 TaxID=3062491 RepID=UPI002677385D|nr:hypothetical protein [Mucilaginibacter sp. L3T2-6]MDO3644849.1 hypothetical protein [Mucilaginibacter sp. L3T2-6]MDV6217257.1 hypothetical protein [Mucilaginibacter sp. L3T2-6]